MTKCFVCGVKVKVKLTKKQKGTAYIMCKACKKKEKIISQ